MYTYRKDGKRVTVPGGSREEDEQEIERLGLYLANIVDPRAGEDYYNAICGRGECASRMCSDGLIRIYKPRRATEDFPQAGGLRRVVAMG